VADGTTPEEIIRRKQAQSGVGYADAVALYESRERVILFRPWFIPHDTKPTGLSGKIEVWPRNRQGFRVGISPTTEISLDEAATTRLLDTLQRHVAVASGAETGDYAVIQLTSGADAPIASRDPGALARALAALLENQEVLARFSEEDLAPVLVDALRGTLRLRELRRAVVELQDMLDGGVVEERAYQRWCEEHSWAFGLQYLDADKLRRISAGDDIDIVLPAIESGFRDLAELKRPNHEVIRWDNSHKSYFWSPETSAAIGQCSRYPDVLHEEAQKGLRDHPEVVAWHPRATIVIGRSEGWSDEQHRGLSALNDRLHGIWVMTYDHLLAQGQRLVSILEGGLGG
jgi:hypothetical protein